MQPYITHPTVFLVGKTYQILFLTETTGQAWVEIGGEKFCDANNGVLRWNDRVHRVTVPCSSLDAAHSYTVCFQQMSDRLPYRPEHGETETRTYAFTPVPAGTDTRICYLSDTHGLYDAAMTVAAKEPFDLLVLGGDITSHNSTEEDLWLALRISGEAAKGELPTVYSRGNHDTRGPMATYLPSLMGTQDGKTYFTFRTADTFGIVLDCGEDKWDDHVEYGGTICFEQFRREETAWLRALAASDEWKRYEKRIAICHVPFIFDMPEPFGIEKDTYREWVELLNEIGIDFLLAGHTHRAFTVYPDNEHLLTEMKFPTIVASIKREHYAGAFLTYGKDSCDVRITHETGEVTAEKVDFVR